MPVDTLRGIEAASGLAEMDYPDKKQQIFNNATLVTDFLGQSGC